ncbi:hypothetical protein H9Q09_11990 [Aurantimonas sp. DM33-3]|uniref:hypothetical protein n=1 Tax=Aurantimonas sp. DM33-3 TaxID=2766955 RepID=UPI001652100D|nr:hypothetical protein [Aurantimonas sp. DM33-3]MBC6716929.1 hypothetical protein [Aurantimonas sp. DM33-3]
MTDDRQLPLFPTLEHSPHACARAISGARAACGVYQHTSLPAGASPRAGNLFELSPYYQALYRFHSQFGETEGLWEELVEEQRAAEAHEAKKAERSAAKAEADRIAAEAEARRQAASQAAWDEYAAFREDALAYLYE